MYYCSIYGVTVKSTLYIDEGIEIEPVQNPDVVVEEGFMPDEVYKAREQGVYSGFRDMQFWFYVDDLGFFYIEDGNHIIIEEHRGETEYTIMTYLTGLAFALLFTQRGFVPMHGSVLEFNGKGCLLTGTSGSGKSSTALQLLRQGGVFVADDIGMIDSETMLVNPGFPIQRLCLDQVERNGYDKDKLKYLGEMKNKYARRLVPGEYKYEKCPLDVIIWIKQYDGDELICQEVVGNEKLKIVLNNVYCYFFISDIKMKPASMKQYIKIALGTRILSIIRPKGVDTMDEIIDFIKNTI